MILPDLLEKNLDVVFCGTAASKKSKELNAYYAGPGNKFWITLNAIGITPTVLKPYDYKRLLDYNIGLTDICKTDYGNDSELNKKNYDQKDLYRKILKFKPRVVCFNGKNAALAYLKKKSVDYGYQSEKTEYTKFFIAPSTSGAANRFWNISIWKELVKI